MVGDRGRSNLKRSISIFDLGTAPSRPYWECKGDPRGRCFRQSLIDQTTLKRDNYCGPTVALLLKAPLPAAVMACT